VRLILDVQPIGIGRSFVIVWQDRGKKFSPEAIARETITETNPVTVRAACDRVMTEALNKLNEKGEGPF
jgi:hypothetical protein